MMDTASFMAISMDDISPETLEQLKQTPVTQYDIMHMKEKLNVLESNISKISYVKARNGIKEKKDRPITEVVSELHESIYWQKPLGLLIMSIYDFAVAHKITSYAIVIMLWLFHNPIVNFAKTILDGPGQWVIRYTNFLGLR